MMRTRRLVTGLLTVVMVSVPAATATAASADPGPPSPRAADARSGDDPGLDNAVARVDRTGCSSGVRWLGKCAVSGYALNRTCGQAWCGLIGTLAGRSVRFYRTDPMASPRPGGYGATRRSQTSAPRAHHCAWGKRRGNTAAYILSKYGEPGADNRAAAAVDLAITHVLCQPRKRWRVGGEANDRRLREASRRYGFGAARRKALRERARSIITEARHQRGPYRLRLSASDAAVGDPVTITARLRSRADRPAGSRRLVLRKPDGSTSDAFTNSRGVAKWSFSMPAGSKAIRVRAPRLEEYRVYRKKPNRVASTRLALAGKHYAMARTITISTKAVPTLRLTTSSAQIPDRLPAAMSYEGSLGSAERKVTVRLRGPGWASMGCTSSPVARSTTWTLDGDGRYRLPKPGGSWAPKVGKRYYRWQVSVAGDARNVERSVCSGPVRMDRAQPEIQKDRMRPVAGTVFRRGAKIRPASFRYQGGYGSGKREVITRTWGPFASAAAASCAAGEAKLAREQRWSLDDNGTYGLIRPGARIRLHRRGWFRFQVVVKGDEANDKVKRCGPRFRVR